MTLIKQEVFSIVHDYALRISMETQQAHTDVSTIRHAARRILELTERFVEPHREPLDPPQTEKGPTE